MTKAKFYLVLMFLMLLSANSLANVMTQEFGDTKSRMKKVLVLPAVSSIEATVGDVTTPQVEEAERYAARYNLAVAKTLSERGFELVFLDPLMRMGSSEQRGIDALLIEAGAELKRYKKDIKGLRYNWYGIYSGVEELRDLYQVEGFVLPVINGEYAATKPSMKQLGTSIFASALAGAIVGSGSLGGVSSSFVSKDSINIDLVFIDSISGKFDASFGTKITYSRSMPAKDLKTGEKLWRKADKGFDKAFKKTLKKVPLEHKKVKVQILADKYELMDRLPISEASDSSLIEDIESLLKN